MSTLTSHFHRVWITAACGLVVAGSVSSVSFAQQKQKSPEEVYAARPSNLSQIPAGWMATNPVQLTVYFNLKSPPNSAQANVFLETWYRSIKALPDRVEIKLNRVVSPAKYSYAVALTFRNWEEYRAYETSAAFLKYYRENWKPEVTEAEEHLSVVDLVVSKEDRREAR